MKLNLVTVDHCFILGRHYIRLNLGTLDHHDYHIGVYVRIFLVRPFWWHRYVIRFAFLSLPLRTSLLGDISDDYLS